MDEKEMRAKIRKHNEKVRYNQSLSSWITDIIACLIFFPNDYYGCLQKRQV